MNLPCGHSCHVSVFLENDVRVRQRNFVTTCEFNLVPLVMICPLVGHVWCFLASVPLMPIAEVIPQNDVQENVSLLVRVSAIDFTLLIYMEFPCGGIYCNLDCYCVKGLVILYCIYYSRRVYGLLDINLCTVQL